MSSRSTEVMPHTTVKLTIVSGALFDRSASRRCRLVYSGRWRNWMPPAAMAEKQTFVYVATTYGSWPVNTYDASDEVAGLRLESPADFHRNGWWV
jgi:hypothetical protein